MLLRVSPRSVAKLCFGCVLALSCINPTEGCGCSPAPAAAVIYGQVLDPEGVPVADAHVHARAGSVTCEAPFIDAGTAQTSSSGSFRARLTSYQYIGPERCLEAWAEPPLGSSALASPRVRFTVSFRIPASDSTRVDLRLVSP